jgi:16S rRNA processing protein RimM
LSTGVANAVAVGRVGRAHGRDGSFYVEAATHDLHEGVWVTIAGHGRRIEHRAGSSERPLVRVEGLDDRSAARELRGERLLIAVQDAPLAEGEWLAAELVGCRIEGLGEVRRVVPTPTCDVLEVGDDGVLVPLISHAIRSVDVAGRSIEVDRRFLALDGP